MKPTCILLSCDDATLATAAEEVAQSMFDVRHASRYARSAKVLEDEVHRIAGSGEIEFLFNFLSPVILREPLLKQIRNAAINIHPAPPKWPGVGSASLALYEGDATFGVTAHRIVTKVDAGPIVRVRRFPILESDDCETLFVRAQKTALTLFDELLAAIERTGEVPTTSEKWARNAVTRAEFERWMRVDADDAPEEIRRKARALKHSRFPGPYVEIAGLRFHVLPGAAIPQNQQKAAA